MEHEQKKTARHVDVNLLVKPMTYNVFLLKKKLWISQKKIL